MNGKDLSSLSKQDEDRMFREMKEKLGKDQKMDDEKSMKNRHMRQDNLSALKQQMQEK